MAILGILFVTGMTFLATMNFESQRISIEREADQDEVGVELVESIVDDILRESLIPIIGASEDPSELGQWGSSFDPNPLAWAELPGVHGLMAQIEPYDPDGPLGPSPPIYSYYTDLGLLGEAWGWTPGATIVTSWAFDPLDAVPQMVDSDGDGIADTIQVEVLDRPNPSEPGVVISGAQRGILAKLVNGETTASGSVYVGLRVIPHGGMVNLSESHPSLIRTLFPEAPPLSEFHTPSVNQTPYSPHAEEASLRNRSVLPPRALSPTVVQGDPLNDDDDFQVPGGGDFALWLFPPGDTVMTDDHRYWPFSLDSDDYETWVERMDPAFASDGVYDRRHLVTTISHDDLRSRGGWLKMHNPLTPTVPTLEGDVLERMIEANKTAPNPCSELAFEYTDYPHTIPNGYDLGSDEPLRWCDCFDGIPSAGCEFNARKGRLRLSLPWLGQAEEGDPRAPLDKPGRIRLIQDVFTMMLLNARSPYWGSYIWYDVDGNGFSTEDEMFWDWNPEGLEEIERTAAALTANLWDFADADDSPTRVELRSADLTCVSTAGRPLDRPDCCQANSDCHPGGACVAGRCEEFCIVDSDCTDPAGVYVCTNGLCTPPRQFVYGLERQPFITEVAADVVVPAPRYAVELFNPNDAPIATRNVYRLRVTRQGMVVTDVQLTADVPGGGYLVVLNEASANWVPPFDPPAPVEELSTLTFDLGDTISLIRQGSYDDPTGSGPPILVDVVVDEFKVVGDSSQNAAPPDIAELGRGENSVQRPNVVAGDVTGRWFSPLPARPVDEEVGHTLGSDNITDHPERSPVEVLFANDQFSSFASAFPTTGSLLLLMRHANREYDPVQTDLAFTTKLVGSSVEEEIDNGRMPVFDEADDHHYSPDSNPLDATGTAWPANRPGELLHLPWGQLVFDYFTALPLSNEGPYSNPKGDPFFEVDEAAQPRVDLDGLRVHGRMNINAAPWMALRGLPFIPMEKIPLPFRDTFRTALGLDGFDDLVAWPIGSQLAKAIVAYREVRELFEADINGDNHTTGNFGDAAGGHGWVSGTAARRGTGFMSVGELANVRHAGAGEPQAAPACPGDPACDQMSYRIDSGELDPTAIDPNYLDAIAVLASLGDWVSVRSHVFTVYGTIRGDADPDYPGNPADEVDARAIRFQETVDRLPTFIGAPAPVRIGERVLSRYNDLRSD